MQTEAGIYVKASSLKGKPLKERLVLGSSLQIHQAVTPAFDLSPFSGFRFNKRWSIALGGTYRLAFDKNHRIATAHSVYGGRLFLQSLIRQKFLLHGEYELLRANIPSHSLPQEQSRAWVDGIMFGVGKEYNITKKLKGNVLTLYNFSYQQQGPYLLRWNIRFGFVAF